MSQNLIQTSFSSGEIAPSLHGAVDLAAYHSGLALLENCYVNYKGGVSNRTGTAFIGKLPTGSRLLGFQFKTSGVIQTYCLVFSHRKMQVVKDGGFVLDDATAITGISQANPGIVSIALGHTIQSGDSVVLEGINGMTELNGKTVIATNVTGDNFQLYDIFGNSIDTTGFTAYASGGTASAHFSIETPYVTEHLAELLRGTVQSADTLTLVHPSYAPRNLTRAAHNDWTLEEINFGSVITQPTGLTGTASGAGAASFAYVVTAVTESGEESIASLREDVTSAVNIAATAGSIALDWTAVDEAVGYNVYKAQGAATGTIPIGVGFGFIGFSRSTSFIDTNIIPDFAQAPPEHFNPFAIGAVLRVRVTNGGAGYTQGTVSASITSATGSGAVLAPVVTGGAVVAIIVLNSGQGYLPTDLIVINGQATGSGATATVAVTPLDGGITFGGSLGPVTVTAGGTNYISPTATVPLGAGVQATMHPPKVEGGVITAIYMDNPGTLYDPGAPPAITITDTVIPGSGALAELVLSEQSGVWPGATAFFQQRKVYGATENAPQTLWFSQPGLFNNFDVSRPLKDDDSIIGALVSKQVNDIKFMIEMPGGLIVLTGGGNAWLVSGGGAGEAITPVSILAAPQAYNGCADAIPIPIIDDILYVQAKGTVVRAISFDLLKNIYKAEDVSVLSNHLLTGYTIPQWAWAEEPGRIIWSVRDDGQLLSLTWLREQKIKGWGHSHTLGLFKSACSIVEGNEDATYLVIERYIQGQWIQYLERFASRSMPYGIEDAWFVDCGLQSSLTYPNATLTASAASGSDVLFEADVTVFNSGNVGDVLRMGGGIATITSFVNNRRVRGTLTKDIDRVLYLDHSVYADVAAPANVPLPAESGEWSIATPFTTFSGLDHLKGQIVSMLGDGSVSPQQTVNGDGEVTFPSAVTKATVGLPYAARVQTLRPGEIIIQGKRVKIPAVTLRLMDTRGIKVGNTFTTMKAIKQRNTQPMGSPIQIGQGSWDYYFTMDPLWSTNAQVCVRQDDPLPMTLLALIPEIILGDTDK